MSNINCTNSSCMYMADGKCCLDTVTELHSNCERNSRGSYGREFENVKLCPYYTGKP